MYLGNFIKNIGKKYSKLDFSGIAFDSRKVKKNYIFFAINGNKLNGYDYIADAINNGAKIIIYEKSIKLKKKNITSINKKTKKISCCNWYEWKIICARFLLSNIKFK